ncbi:helix-turn-helix domain-containing protein [Microbacterium sp. NPDC055665]
MTNEATFATTAEAAETLGVSVKTITRWVTAEKLTPVKRLPGKRGAMLFASADIEALLAHEPWDAA